MPFVAPFLIGFLIVSINLREIDAWRKRVEDAKISRVVAPRKPRRPGQIPFGHTKQLAAANADPP